MRNDGFENMILTEQIDRKRNKRKEFITYLVRLSKWIPEEGL